MKIIKKLIIILIIMLLCSCSMSNIEDVLFRTVDDPFYDIPITDSFRKENTIFLTWAQDDACDEFILNRAFDNKELHFEPIYIGKDTNFVDVKTSEYQRYIYRLDKKRGNKMFYGKDVAYGVAFPHKNDDYEPNDTIDSAMCLEHRINCSLPYVKYIYNSKEVFDEDWYYVDVMPHYKTEITVMQNDCLIDKRPTNILYQVEGSELIGILQNKGFMIGNNENFMQRFYFKLKPNSITLSENSSAGCVTSIHYNIRIQSITPL